MMEHDALHISVDCVIFGYDDNGLKVLLINQQLPNNGLGLDIKSQPQLPGDLILINEGLLEAAKRVLLELTQLNGIYLKQFHAFGDPTRVQDAKDRAWLQSLRTLPDQRVITVAYFGLVSLQDFSPKPASFAGSVHWVDLNDIPALAFDHNEILSSGFEALREQLESHHISFELLPKKFTLSQLQALYELVLDKKFDKRNFRKNVKRMPHVVPLNEKQKGVMHKPAQLFSFNPNEISE
ncbi:MAG TPA: NUDIX hydrolase [Flavobacteriales bacterium]|nr:NUDIX hydrolase [Flavobacteriales bacterium]